VHPAHTAHAAAWHGWSVLLRRLSDHGLGRDHEASDRSRVLQSNPHDLRRIDDAGVQHIDILLSLGVEAESLGLVGQDLADDDRALYARILGDLADRRLKSPQHDIDAGLDIGILVAELADRGLGAQQRHASARNDAFLYGGLGRVHRVLDAIFLFLHLDFGRAANTDYGDAASELGEPLLQLLFVVVGGRLLDLRLDLGDASFNVGLLAGAVDDRGVLLFDPHPLGAAEHLERHVLKLDAEVLGDHSAAGQDGDVLEHRLAPIAEPRRFYGRNLETAAQFVDDERRKRLAFDILGDNQERLARLHHRLEDRQQCLQAAQLLFVNEDIRIVEFDDHLLGVGDEIGREIAAIELHALDDVELGYRGLRLLDRDHALVADLFHRVGDHLADRLVAVRCDGSDLGDLFGGLHLLGAAFDVLHDRGHRDVDAALQIHRVHAGGDQLEALFHDRGGQYRRRGGAVAGNVVGLRGDLAHHLCAHVLELVFELDLLGDGDPVLGNARRAV